MPRYLITHSLLSSWAYTFDCYEGGEEAAYEDFLRVLRRERGEPTEAMQNGINFENAVYTVAAGGKNPEPKWESGVSALAEILKGAPAQVKLSRELEVDGMTFLVYGILDSLKAGTIYDVKFLNKGLGSADIYGKYLTSTQHPAYFYICPEADDFRYLVCDGTDYYIEQYRREETRFIGDCIHDFILGITEAGLLDLYKSKWEANG